MIDPVQAAALPATWRAKLLGLPHYAFDQHGTIYGPVDPSDDTFVRTEDLRACADELEATQLPMGTYNCPICGWNVPHSEHATEMMERLAIEKNAETEKARALARRLVSVATFVRSLLGTPTVAEINAMTEPYGSKIDTSRD